VLNHRVNQVRSRLTTLPVNQRVIRVQDRRGNWHCNHRTNPRHSRQKSPRISPLSSLPYNLQANQPASLTGSFQRHQRHNYHSSYLHSHRCSLLTNLWDILPAIHSTIVTTIEWDNQSVVHNHPKILPIINRLPHTRIEINKNKNLKPSRVKLVIHHSNHTSAMLCVNQ
jgi:hypothetical protein